MSNEEVMSSYVEAWNAHDPVRVAGHFAADGVREWHVVQPPMIEGPTRFQGRADIAAGVTAFMTAVPDMTVEIHTLVETEWGGIGEWTVRATHTGAWDGWSGQGEQIELPGVSIFHIVDGALTEERMFFDPDMMARNWVPPLRTMMAVGTKLWKQGRAIKKARKAALGR